MKNIMMIAAAVIFAVGMVSCQQDYDLQIAELDDPITFSASVEAQSRTSDSSTKESFDNFGAYCVSYTGTFSDSVLNTTPRIDNYKVELFEGAWSYAPTKMWPTDSGAETIFFGYAPYYTTSGSGVSNVSLSSSGLQLDFEVQEQNADQIDLKTAEPQKIAGTSTDAVAMSFMHNLTKISFKATGDNTVKIKSLALKGVYDNATLNVWSSGRNTWSNFSTSDSDSEFHSTLIDDCTLSTEENRLLTADEGYLMMIPQTLPSDAVIVASFYDESIDSDVEQYFSIGNTTWIENMQYTYILKVESSVITFLSQGIEVSDWERSFNYEFDENGEVIIPLTDYIDIEVFSDVESLKETIAERTAAGITDFVVVGEYYIGCLGSDIYDEDNACDNPFITECEGVTSIDLSQVTGLTTVPAMAFYADTSFFDDDLYDDMTDEEKLEYLTTNSSSTLTTVILPESVVSIGAGAFYGCTSLTDINLDNVESVGTYGFALCTSLESIDSDSMTSVGAASFAYGVSIEYINLENLVYSSLAPFGGLLSLTYLNLPSLVVLGVGDLGNCTALETVILENCISLGWSCFSGCTSLTYLELSSPSEISTSVYNGGDQTFDYMDTTICDLVLHANKEDDVINGNEWPMEGVVWKSITYVGDPDEIVIDGMINLDTYNTTESLIETIKWREENGVNQYYLSGTYYEGVLGSDYDPVTDESPSNPFMLYAPSAFVVSLESVTGFTDWPKSAFSAGLDQYGEDPLKSTLMNIVPPQSGYPTTASEYVFAYTYAFNPVIAATVDFKDYASYKSNVSMGNYYIMALGGELDLSNAETFGKSSFEGSSYESITLESVTSIGSRAFADMSNLYRLTIEGDTNITIAEDAFDDTNTKFTQLRLSTSRRPIFGFATPMVDYYGGNTWGGYEWLEIIYLDSSGDYTDAFGSDIYTIEYSTTDRLLAEIDYRLENGVTEFNIDGTYLLDGSTKPNLFGSDVAISSLSDAESAEVNNPITTLLPEITSLDFSAYYGETDIPVGAFFPGYTDGVLNPSSLTSVDISRASSSLGAFAFLSCPNLERVSICSSLTELQPYTFYDCPKLSWVGIGSYEYLYSVTKVGERAFANSPALSDFDLNLLSSRKNLELANSAFEDTTIGNLIFQYNYNSSYVLTFGDRVFANSSFKGLAITSSGDYIIPSDAFEGTDTEQITLTLHKSHRPKYGINTPQVADDNKTWMNCEWKEITYTSDYEIANTYDIYGGEVDMSDYTSFTTDTTPLDTAIEDIALRYSHGAREFTLSNCDYKVYADLWGSDLDFTDGNKPAIENKFLLAAPEATYLYFGSNDYPESIPVGAFHPGYDADGNLNESKLEYIYIPTTKDIGEYAFYGCVNAETIIINQNPTTIPAYAFYGCKKLKNMVWEGYEINCLANSSEVGEYAFAGCESLEYIAFRSTKIGSHALDGCGATTLQFSSYYEDDSEYDFDFTGFDTEACTLITSSWNSALYDESTDTIFGAKWKEIIWE